MHTLTVKQAEHLCGEFILKQGFPSRNRDTALRILIEGPVPQELLHGLACADPCPGFQDAPMFTHLSTGEAVGAEGPLKRHVMACTGKGTVSTGVDAPAAVPAFLLHDPDLDGRMD
jgi:hypothetical protein